MNGNDPGGSGSGSTPIRYQLQGTAASRGIAIGNARKILPNLVQLIQWTPLAPAERHYHIERYEHARRELVESFRVGLGNAAYVPDTRAIVETYEMIVSDPDVDAAIRHHILTSGMPAEVAVTTAYNAHIRALSLAGTPEFRERRFELDIIRQKLLQFLSGSQTRSSDISGAIIVASSLLASDVVYYHSCGIAGIVTEIGGISSHACIVARSLGIPAVIGVRKALSVIPDDAVVIVDGSQGEVIVSPDATTLEQYCLLQNRVNAAGSVGYRSSPVATADGVLHHVFASVDAPDEVSTALDMGADGIGLVRTEMLLAHSSTFPSEEEQYNWYHMIAHKAYPKPVTLRIFDVGSDKIAFGVPPESNPALGLRGIRFLLRHPEIFRAQIRALYRASAIGNLRMLIPMVTTIEELLATRQLISDVAAELRSNNVAFDENMPIGMMIETPSAALLAEYFAEHVSFFSIGSNDLTQYTLAADRTSDQVAHIFDQLHPAVLRLVYHVSQVACAHHLPLELCGDMATFLAATPLLIGLGIRTFSVAPSYVQPLKARIASTQCDHAQQLLTHALECRDVTCLYALLDRRTESPSQDTVV